MSTAVSDCSPQRASATIQRVSAYSVRLHDDQLAREEPLEIRIRPKGSSRAVPLAVTMRTPGHDAELAVGFLVSEGIVCWRDDIQGVYRSEVEGTDRDNRIDVELSVHAGLQLENYRRSGIMSSSCGVCGKTSLAAVRVAQQYPLGSGPTVDIATICRLPDYLAAAQPTFSKTGGLHAAALFDDRGKLLAVYEDVGRHNALDKLIGAEHLSGRLPLNNRIALVSGRAGFELVQKSVLAAIPILAAVGAPSHLAVELARDRGLTLIGFLREQRFNVYSGAARIRPPGAP